MLAKLSQYPNPQLRRSDAAPSVCSETEVYQIGTVINGVAKHNQAGHPLRLCVVRRAYCPVGITRIVKHGTYEDLLLFTYLVSSIPKHSL